MELLVIGSGGREHVLAWALANSPRVSHIWVAPGNAGTETQLMNNSVSSKLANLPIASDDIDGLRTFAVSKGIGLTVVGPEVPLANGIVDAFHRANLRIFGPVQAAAQLESSKAFAKEFMVSHRIPTAAYKTFSDYHTALAWVHELKRPIVVKADGLAAGKGVIICDTVDDAALALKRCMVNHEFGNAGTRVIVEERLTGREVSILAFCDGQTVLTMPPARDHKRVFDNDLGPNTGGMGAYAPVPDVSQQLVDEITRTVLQPAVDGMAALGTP
ncbi:MAG TPA: phosphoribosylamine--glycine ligase, partial [Anaerolineae bacterium]